MKPSDFLNIITSYLPTIIAGIGNLICIPIISRNYNSHEFGYFLLTATILNILNFTNLGIPQALTRRLALCSLGEIEDKKSQEINSAFIPSTIFTALAGLIAITFICTNLSTTNLNIQTVTAVTIFSVYALRLFSEIFDSVIKSTGKYYASNGIAAISLTIQLTLTSATALSESTMPTVIASQIIGPITSLLLSFYVSKKFCRYNLGFRLFQFPLLVEIIKESQWYFVSAISMVAIFQGNQVVITKSLGIDEFGKYAAMYRFCDLFRIGLSNISSVFFQQLAILNHSGQSNELRQKFFKIHRAVIYLALIGGTTGWLFGFEIYRLWIGKEKTGEPETFYILLVLSALYGINQVSSTFLGAFNEHAKAVRIGLLQGFLSISLTFTLLQFFKTTTIAALSSVLSLILTNFWYNPFLAVKRIKI